jgi:hypothetical protein
MKILSETLFWKLVPGNRLKKLFRMPPVIIKIVPESMTCRTMEKIGMNDGEENLERKTFACVITVSVLSPASD